MQTIKYSVQNIARNAQLMLIQVCSFCQVLVYNEVYEGPLKSNSEHIITTSDGSVNSYNATTGQREWYFQNFGSMLCY